MPEPVEKEPPMKRKEKIKAPPNLEAVYKDGVFIGRKPFNPPIHEIAQSPADYLRIIKDSRMASQMRFDGIVAFLLAHDDRVEELATIEFTTWQEIIDHIPPAEQSILLDFLKPLDYSFLEEVQSYLEQKIKTISWESE